MAKTYPISGTFIDEITYDIPSNNWSMDDWTKDLEAMQSVGIDTLVFIRGGWQGRTIFPSKHFNCYRQDDLVEHILNEAAKRHMRVFLGLYISNLTWNDGDWKEEVRQNRFFIDEAYEKYAHYPSFAGWYIPHEVATNIYNIGILTKELAKMCKEKTPDKLVMLSPFFPPETTLHTRFTPERFIEEWDEIFSSFQGLVDICAYQDGSAPIETALSYFQAAKILCQKHHIHLWANAETFERDVRFLYFPIPFELLRYKLDLIGPYVEKTITFEFSHFMSPNSLFPSAHNLFQLYKEHYGKDK